MQFILSPTSHKHCQKYQMCILPLQKTVLHKCIIYSCTQQLQEITKLFLKITSSVERNWLGVESHRQGRVQRSIETDTQLM